MKSGQVARGSRRVLKGRNNEDEYSPRLDVAPKSRLLENSEGC